MMSTASFVILNKGNLINELEKTTRIIEGVIR